MKIRFFEDFKKFIMRGNVVDLAVGVIIGAAFGKIVDALTAKVLMPILGPIVGATSEFEKLVWKFKWPWNGQEVNVQYGAFLNAVVQFVILAFCVFLIVKLMSTLIKKHEEKSGPGNEEKLLAEIRDLLKSRA